MPQPQALKHFEIDYSRWIADSSFSTRSRWNAPFQNLLQAGGSRCRSSQRTQEIGVRMALGAAPSTVLRMTLKDGALMILAGIAAGVIASLALVNLMSSLLFGVKPTDLPTFVVVVGVLCSIGFLACYVPARRALKIDPVVALREE
jgi:predicted lysophospholipase L1 biosynthesis ABC-type transport system permease subunit